MTQQITAIRTEGKNTAQRNPMSCDDLFAHICCKALWLKPVFFCCFFEALDLKIDILYRESLI